MSVKGPGSPHSRHARAPKVTREMIQGNNGFIVSEEDRAYARKYFADNPFYTMINPDEDYDVDPRSPLAGRKFNSSAYALKDDQGNIYALHFDAILGNGNYGTVFVCQVIHSVAQDTPTGKYFAVKIQMTEGDADKLSAIQRENVIARHHDLVVAEILDFPPDPTMIATIMPLLPGKDLIRHFPGYFNASTDSSSVSASSEEVVDLFRGMNRQHSQSTGSYSLTSQSPEGSTTSLSGTPASATGAMIASSSTTASTPSTTVVTTAPLLTPRSGGMTMIDLADDINLFPIEFVLRTFALTDGALAKFHNEGSLHLDFKPQNVRADIEEDEFHVFDCGLSKRMDEADIPPPCKYQKGTPHYMAPEYFDDRYQKPLSTAQDTYASARAKELLISGLLKPLFVESIYEDKAPTDIIILPDVFTSMHLIRIQINNPSDHPKIWALNQFLQVIYAQKHDTPEYRLSPSAAQDRLNIILEELNNRLAERAVVLELLEKVSSSLSKLQQMVALNRLIADYNNKYTKSIKQLTIVGFDGVTAEFEKRKSKLTATVEVENSEPEMQGTLEPSNARDQYCDDLEFHEQLLYELNEINTAEAYAAHRPASYLQFDVWHANRRALLSRVEARILRYEHEHGHDKTFISKRLHRTIGRLNKLTQRREIDPLQIVHLTYCATLVLTRHDNLKHQGKLIPHGLTFEKEANTFLRALKAIKANNDGARKHGKRTNLDVKPGCILSNDQLNDEVGMLIERCEVMLEESPLKPEESNFNALAELIAMARDWNRQYYGSCVNYPENSALFLACERIKIPEDISAKQALEAASIFKKY